MSSTSLETSIRPYHRRCAYALVGAFSFGWMILMAGMTAMNPLLPLIRSEFDLSGTETGLLTWAFTLPYLLMQIPAGVLSDRLGAKRILVVMMLVSGLGLVAQGLWSYGLAALIASGVIHRLGAGVYYPTAFGVATGSVPAVERGKASALLVMGMALGSALGLSLAVPLHEIGGNNWRFPLLAFGLLTLLLPAMFQFLTWPTRQRGTTKSGGVANALRDRSLVALFAINFCSNYGFQVVVVWGPSFMSGERGLSLALAGFYVALINLVGFPSGLLSGALSDRIGRRQMTMLLFLAAGAALMAFATLREPILLLAAIVGFGIAGKWSSDGVLAAWMGDHVAAKFASAANSVYGVNNTARMAGALLAPPITGALLDHTGTLSTGLFLAAAVLCSAAFAAPLIQEQSPRANA